MDKQSFLKLSTKVAEGTADEAELSLYNNYLNLYAAAGWDEVRMGKASSLKEELHTRITLEMGSMPKTIPFYRRSAFLYLAAACIALIVSGIAVLFFNPHVAILYQDPDAIAAKNDIPPGRNTATLTLADGSTITLSDAKTGVIIDASSIKYSDGSKIDNSSLRGRTETSRGNLPGRGPSTTEMLTASTPRGGTYQVVLPDGTKAWLNAASSIKFPSSFSRLKQRRVEITGEVYLEVKKDKAHPFILKSAGQQVEVLGTHFNVSAYKGEPTRTTLLEGSVLVSSFSFPSSRETEGSLAQANSRDPSMLRDDGKRAATILKPGQQALTSGAQMTVREVIAEQAVAWKKGYFMFNDQPLEEVMESLARWYGVTVQYTDESLKSENVYGTISKFSNISKVLGLLEKTKVMTCRINGKEILISRVRQ